ncbi:uncharacterized protein EHS24_006651 [Apiotrichum porosum]|uniref:Uncharacterized protein n=1 Tax=Apiotrichum porosum TaxID=105984 RepID=A0A427Y1V0_9TREE|nr:uncharacterized protein EHS24_006651 [Apiotrichum porosum]RSH85061.1 hypothetical protein EHS24_006651 [Apiotrichum porosum]
MASEKTIIQQPGYAQDPNAVQPQPTIGHPVQPFGAMGAPAPTNNPECAQYGRDTRIGPGPIVFLVCCLPWSLIWLLSRRNVTCRGCHATMPPQGLID